MATRSLSVQITGDARSLNRVLDSTESRTKRWGGAMAKGFAVAGAAAAGGLAVGLKKSAEAAIEAEKSQAKMVTQLKAAGVSYRAHAKQIDEVIQKTSKLSGLDDEDLQDSFTNIVRVTGDVNKSLRLTGLAADFARAKHMDVAKAGELVGKVAGGNTGILSRYGITVQKGATAQEALALLQQKFAGQAAAYGKTTAGALDRAGVASENLGEIVGAKVTPLLAKGAIALVNLVDKAGQLAGPIREVSGTLGNFARRVQAAFSGGNKDAAGFAQSIRRNVTRVIDFLRDLGQSIARIFKGSGEDFRTIGQAFLKVEKVAAQVVEAITKRVLPILKAAIEGIAIVIRGVVKIVAGILSGDFRKAWQGAKDVVRGTLHALVGIIKGLWDVLKDAMVGLAKAMIHGLVAGLKGLAGAIKNAVINGIRAGVNAAKGAAGDIIAKINPFGDGIGRAARSIAGDGLGFLGGSAGGSGAGLMGADLDLGPFARIGAGMGLRVSSGLRPGSVTSSGNTSYHSSGDAIDMAGPPSAMGRFFQTMRGMFGSRLRELIYTPGPGPGIKDGRPYTYTGQVAQDHYDHVHVAYTGPFGDGLGRFSSTAYGPPWGGIQGTGVTATGVNLKGSPHRYGVAVDPSVIPLGTRLKISPNPFNYGGYFTAFDTGGAIKGNRLDFYDWRGRASQMQWGNRSVTVWTEDEAPTAAERRSGHAAPSGPMSPREAFRQSQENASLQQGVALRTARRRGGGKWVMGPRGIPVLRGAGSGPLKTGLVSDLSGGEVEATEAVSDPAAEALTAAIEASTKATEDHTAALKTVGGEMKRQTDLAQQYASTSEFQKTKYIADIFSGQFGRGIVGRGFTPGTGIEYAYALSIFQVV